MYWGLRATTTRIPRVNLSTQFKQTFEDVVRSYLGTDPDNPGKTKWLPVPELQDSYDHSWHVWLRLRADLHPGPQVVLRAKYFDEFTEETEQIPADTRGETCVDLYLSAAQKLHLDFIPGSFVRLHGGWTHWLDERKTWATRDRDELLIKGYFTVKF